MWFKLQFTPGGPVDNKSASVLVMARCLFGIKPLPEPVTQFVDAYINGLVQDCSNSSALAMELLQSCNEPLICCTRLQYLKSVNISPAYLQDCSNSSALAMELLQSCTEPLICCTWLQYIKSSQNINSKSHLISGRKMVWYIEVLNVSLN